MVGLRRVISSCRLRRRSETLLCLSAKQRYSSNVNSRNLASRTNCKLSDARSIPSKLCVEPAIPHSSTDGNFDLSETVLGRCLGILLPQYWIYPHTSANPSCERHIHGSEGQAPTPGARFRRCAMRFLWRKQVSSSPRPHASLACLAASAAPVEPSSLHVAFSPSEPILPFLRPSHGSRSTFTIFHPCSLSAWKAAAKIWPDVFSSPDTLAKKDSILGEGSAQRDSGACLQ